MERIRMIGGGTVTSCPFPIGFGGFFQTDPNTLYKSTTWEQKKDVFILAAGKTYPAGSTGGEAQHTLTIAEMPSHTHFSNDGWSGYASRDYRIGFGDTLTYSKVKNADHTKPYYSDEVGLDSTLSSTGNNQPHNNLPPYFAMPFWVRTA